jgi:hypothetical protein
MDLAQAARHLDLEPFEIVRLLVASGKTRETFSFDTSSIAALASFAGIERWWDEWSPSTSDGVDPRKAVVLAALGRLLQGEFIGANRTRQDNLWRGLQATLRESVESAVDVLIEDGVLILRAATAGLEISIREDAQERVVQFAAGEDLPVEITRHWAA